ncbi:MAG: MFS transporter [Ilumatobacteraceae bacterium]
MTDQSSAPTRAYLLAFVVLGIAASIGGFALTHLRERAGDVDNAAISLIFVVSAVGYVIGSFTAGRGLDAGAGHRRWVLAIAVLVATWAVMAAATSLWLMLVASVFAGLAGGVCDASGNTLVVWSRPDGNGALLNALHLSFAIGVMVCPFVVRVSLWAGDTLWLAVAVMAILGAGSIVPMVRSAPPVRTRVEVAERSTASGARTRHVVFVCVFFFAYVAYETTFLTWIATFTEEIGYARAVTGVSFMAGAGFTLGRVLAVPAASRFTPGRILAATMAASLVVLAVFLASHDAGPLLWVIAFLFGAAVAPQYASMMGYAESHLALSGRNTSAIVATSGMGGLAIPYVMGELFDRRGARSLPETMLVLGVLAAGTALVIGRTVGRAGAPAPATD